MIANDERLIIVIGMAHSGTTILTFLLKQHPDVVCCRNGSENWIFENTWLPSEQSQPIQHFLWKNPNRRILLKRPWNAVYHGDWMAREMPNARYLNCTRPFEEISKSWAKPTSFVNPELRDADEQVHRQVYDACLLAADLFSKKVKHFRSMPHQDLLDRPQHVMAESTAWLGLQPFWFDVSKVSTTQNIKDWLSITNQFPRQFEAS
jgi:hypothetical protein